jgi:hypothetical protein
MSDWPLEIDGWEYHPIPENWLAAGRDETAPDGPQCLAVSVAILRPNTLKIRYAHPRHDSVGAVIMPASVRDSGSVPDPDGRPWSRSIGAAGLNPCGVLRAPEQRHLRELWSDRVDALEAGEELVADGGEIQNARDCPECGAETYQFERCHECGDVPWKQDSPGAFVDDWRERHGLDEDDDGGESR